MTWPTAAQFTSAIPGDGFDGWQNYWNQWWIKVALVDRVQSPFYTDLLYAPTGVGLYFHTLNPFNGLTTLPVQLSLGLIPAYNAVVFLSWPLAGYGLYLLVRWLLPVTKETPTGAMAPSWCLTQVPPFVAGLIFTFAPFHMAHLLGHMQVMSLQWIPFYVLYLLRTLHQVQQGRAWLQSAAMAGLFLTLTGLCDWYFVLYLFLFTGLALLWHWLLLLRMSGRLQQIHATVQLPQLVVRGIVMVFAAALAGVVMVLLLSPMLVPMVREATQFSFMVRPTTDLYILSATLADFLIPNRLHTLFRPDSFTWPGNQIAPVSERTIALGYLPLILAISGFWFARRQQRLQQRLQGFWLATVLFFLLLALGPVWHWLTITAADIPTMGQELPLRTPFALLNEVIPFMRISRSVSRYALMVQLGVAVLSALGLYALLDRIQRGDRGVTFKPVIVQRAVSGLAIVIVLFEFWVAPFPMSPPDTPSFYANLQTMEQAGTLLNLPMNYDRPGYLLYQTVHQHPLAVAYISRDDPRTLTERTPVLQHFRHLGDDIIVSQLGVIGQTVLHDLGIAFVVLDRYKMPGGLEREYTEQLAQTLFGSQSPLYSDERLTVYQVKTLEASQPYLQLGALHWGPLEENAVGQHQRLLGQEGALLYVVHPPQGGTLQIGYRTLDAMGVTIQDEAGRPLAELAPAPTGAVAVIDLAGLPTTVTDIGLPAILLELYPNGEDAAWIETVELLE